MTRAGKLPGVENRRDAEVQREEKRINSEEDGWICLGPIRTPRRLCASAVSRPASIRPEATYDCCMMPGSSGSSARRKVRSIAVRVVVFLLLGAVVNVAVALAIAAFSSPRQAVEMPLSETDSLLIAALLQRFDGSIQDDPSWLLRRGPGVEWITGVNVRNPSADWFSLFAMRSGWPVYSLSGETWLLNSSDDPQDHSLLSIPSRDMVLPLRPLWPGFAINTLVYAAVPWLLFAAPGRVRRWRRIRRGLCIKCAYPVGTSEVCTECGVRIIRRSRGLPSPAPPAGSGGERIT